MSQAGRLEILLAQLEVWRRATVRMSATAAVGGVVFVVGFLLGPGALDGLVGWATSRVARWPIVPDVLVWLDELQPVEVAVTLAGPAFAVGCSWALQPFRNSRRPGSRGGGPVVLGAIPRRAAWFQPRPVEQTALKKALGSKARAALVALPGARGAGKSQLAAVHAHECVKAGYDLVAWVNAETGPVPDLARLGRRLGVPDGPDQTSEQVAAAAIEKVSADDGCRRLLVFDNVEEPDSITAYLPMTGTAKVLITTNRREVTTMPDVVPVEVGMFTAVQGRAFLTAATGQPDNADTAEVGEQLGWLPLGLGQAAAYIRLNQLTYRQYVQRLSRVNIDEALRRHAGAQHQGILAVTQLSMAELDRTDPSGNANGLLTVLSMLAPEGISRALLSKPRAIAALGMDDVGLERALIVLSNASLITQANPETRSNKANGSPDLDRVVVVVHRLTAKVVRHHIANAPKDSYDKAIGTAAAVLEALTTDLPQSHAALRRAELEELAAHILAVRGHTRQFAASLHRLGEWAANNLAEVGDAHRAVTIQQAVLTESEQALGPEHPDTLKSRNNLAEALWAAGRNDEAMPLYEQTLVDRERVLGTDHPDTLNSRHCLAGSYWSALRYDEAIQLYEQARDDRKRILGPDDPDTLMTRNNLATAYWSVGRFDEAIEAFKQVLADRERILEPDHPHTLNSSFSLATVYWSSGRYQEAIVLHEQTLAVHERVLGHDHPHTLNCSHCLATDYRSAGRYQEAIALYKQTLADRERILGPKHPDTLNSRYGLAASYNLVGRYKEAIVLHEPNLADQERILGPDHPHTVNSRTNLAESYRAVGRHDDAACLGEPK